MRKLICSLVMGLGLWLSTGAALMSQHTPAKEPEPAPPSPSVFVPYTLAAVAVIIVMVIVCMPARRD